jgi:hypothetical protein
MASFVALVGYLLVFNAGFGRSQETCWTQAGGAVGNVCHYQITCGNFGLVASGYVTPPSSQASDPCPTELYTCTSVSLWGEIIPGVTEYLTDVGCQPVLNTPATTQIDSTPIALPTKLTLTLPISTPATPAKSTLVFQTAPTLSLPVSTPATPAQSTLVLQTTPTLSLPLPTVSSFTSKIASVSKDSSSALSSDVTSSSSTITSSKIATSSGALILPATATTAYPALPLYTGGDLLRNYCAAAEFTLLPGPQPTIVIYVAFIGCIDEKPDCCPFVVSTNSSNTTTSTTIISLGSFSSLSSIGSKNTPSRSSAFFQPTTPFSSQSTTVALTTVSTRQIFPVAAVQARQTLTTCPQDYYMVLSSCCPM